jgi:large subunit ribosomal protein L31
MKKDLHPQNYQFVVFQDDAANYAFLTRSTAQSSETIVWEDGNTYPLIKVHISSASHPFYTGQEKLMDIEGRVDRFKARQAEAEKRRAVLIEKAKKAAAKKAAPAKKSKDTKES